MPEWYLPDSIRSNNNYLAIFPEISKYAASGDYTQYTMICVWYFDKKETFQEAENKLSVYLVESGNVNIVELDVNDEIKEVLEVREGNNYWSPTFGPKIFNATRYESEQTSGYFLIYSQPFHETRDDYFIVYYGTKANANISEQMPDLKYLIAESYYLSEGSVGPLDAP